MSKQKINTDMSIKEFAKSLVGLPADKAKDTCKHKGYMLREMQVNGKSMVGTCDMRLNRINVATRNNLIVDIIGIG